MNDNQALPQYQSHKKVRALKIRAICGITITPELARYAPFDVTSDYIAKHEPQPGGYYVLYENGHESFSPASAFESGYTLIIPQTWEESSS